MARYHFVTEFDVTADRDTVWGALEDPTGWPSWWRWLKRVDVLDEGGQDRLGARYRYAFGTALPYTLAFETMVTNVQRPAVMQAEASGELEGSGLWRLTEGPDGGTHVEYTWLVETTKRWMNILAPVGRPAFTWNHDVLMRDFAKGVAGVTDSRLVSVHNTALSPRASGFYRLPEATG